MNLPVPSPSICLPIMNVLIALLRSYENCINLTIDKAFLNCKGLIKPIMCVPVYSDVQVSVNYTCPDRPRCIASRSVQR